MSHSENHKTHNIGWLRAAVLGANDGIVSTASLILGVAGRYLVLSLPNYSWYELCQTRWRTRVKSRITSYLLGCSSDGVNRGCRYAIRCIRLKNIDYFQGIVGATKRLCSPSTTVPKRSEWFSQSRCD